MSVSVNAPKTPVTKGSQGVAVATLPNVCKMPGPPAPFVPTPLPNIGRSGDSPKGYTKRVKVAGQPVAIRGASFKSTGDAASKGTGGGLISANTHGPTKFAGPGSRNVKFEGKSVHLLGDPMLNNCNPAGQMPNSATMVGVMQEGSLIALVGDEVCALCGKEHGNAERLGETPDTKADAGMYKAAAERAVAKAAAAREQRLAELRREAQAAAEAKYERAKVGLQKKLFRATSRQDWPEVARLQEQLNTLAPKYNEPGIAPVKVSTMLGVVRCEDNQVYAATSNYQRKEIVEQVPSGWHTPPHNATLFPPHRPETLDRRQQFQHWIPDPTIFNDQWEASAKRAKQYYNNRREDPFNKRREEPWHNPGQCAAQQAVVLALEHGARPAGLTERWYDSKDANATVAGLVRDSTDAPPRLDYFGGDTAVPPCGSCEILLTMLLCPDHREPDCDHRSPATGVCRCT